MQGTLQRSQVVGRSGIVVLVEFEENLRLWHRDFIEAQLAGRRCVARSFRIVPEPEIQYAEPIRDNRRQRVDFLGHPGLRQRGFNPPDGTQ